MADQPTCQAIVGDGTQTCGAPATHVLVLDGRRASLCAAHARANPDAVSIEAAPAP